MLVTLQVTPFMTTVSGIVIVPVFFFDAVNSTVLFLPSDFVTVYLLLAVSLTALPFGGTVADEGGFGEAVTITLAVAPAFCVSVSFNLTYHVPAATVVSPSLHAFQEYASAL